MPDVQNALQSDTVEHYAKEKQNEQAAQIAVAWATQLKEILDAKTTFDEGDGFKRFVLGTGLKVTEASADAEYLGIGVGKLSIGERKTLLKWIEAMGVDYDY